MGSKVAHYRRFAGRSANQRAMEFEQVKACLAEIENRHRLSSPKEERPTLRRRAEGSGGDDNPPVLKRRDDD